MPVDSLVLTLRKPKYSPLEEVIFDVVRTGIPVAGDGSIFVLKIFRNVGANPLTDPLLITEEGPINTADLTFSTGIDLREQENRISLVRTTENNLFTVRGLLGKYYATIEVKNDASTSGGGPVDGAFTLVAVSTYEFRTSYLPERLIYQARLARTNLDPIEIEAALDGLQNVLKNSYQDNELERVLRRAESSIQTKLDTAIRPRKVTSRPDLNSPDNYPGHVNMMAPPPGFDEVARAMSYKRTDARFFTTLQLPRTPVITVDSVRAVYLNQIFFDFPREWFAFDQFGNLNMVPVAGTAFVQFSNAFRAFAPYQSYGAERLPEYWAIDWTYGLVGLEDTFDEVLEMIASKAAIEVLTFIGSADKPGLSSESRSTGGSSESFSYTQSAVYALFSADADYLKKKLPGEIAKLRQKIKGPEMFVL